MDQYHMLNLVPHRRRLTRGKFRLTSSPSAPGKANVSGVKQPPVPRHRILLNPPAVSPAVVRPKLFATDGRQAEVGEVRKRRGIAVTGLLDVAHVFLRGPEGDRARQHEQEGNEKPRVWPRIVCSHIAVLPAPCLP